MSSSQHSGHSTQPESAQFGNLLPDDFAESSAPRHNTVENDGHLDYHNVDSLPQDYSGSTEHFDREDTTYDHIGDSAPTHSHNVDRITEQPESDETRAEHVYQMGSLPDYRVVPDLMKSQSLSNKEKLAILSRYPHTILNRLYEQYVVARGFRQPLATDTLPHKPEELNEDNYLPLIDDTESPPDPDAPQPIYPAYAAHFRTAHDAKVYRKRTRTAPKSHAPDIERVKRYGRPYWVRRIYEAMVDITAISDGDSSIHRQRFTDSPGFDAEDLEATAHHVFDSALAVHERGWTRPKVYHKKVVRGKLTDVSEKSLETRLARICLCLKQKKATVDDAVRGGVTLALLCDNPEARGFTKMSNNTGNKKRGERLKLAKGTEELQEHDSDDE